MGIVESLKKKRLENINWQIWGQERALARVPLWGTPMSKEAFQKKFSGEGNRQGPSLAGILITQSGKIRVPVERAHLVRGVRLEPLRIVE